MAKLNLKMAVLQFELKNLPENNNNNNRIQSKLQTADLWSEHGGAGSDTPAHHRFGYSALSDALADLVLFCASNLGGHSETDYKIYQN